MDECSDCRGLASKPLRPDVPRHLARAVGRDFPFGFITVTAYECVKCDSTWCWRIGSGWERIETSMRFARPPASNGLSAGLA